LVTDRKSSKNATDFFPALKKTTEFLKKYTAKKRQAQFLFNFSRTSNQAKKINKFLYTPFY